jgi:hypothetical protein
MIRKLPGPPTRKVAVRPLKAFANKYSFRSVSHLPIPVFRESCRFCHRICCSLPAALLFDLS